MAEGEASEQGEGQQESVESEIEQGAYLEESINLLNQIKRRSKTLQHKRYFTNQMEVAQE